jgi:hypothetical protein
MDCEDNMEAQNQQLPRSVQDEAVEHVAAAHRLLKAIEHEAAKHPEVAQAITKLEMALNTLAVKTAGML